MKYLLALLMPAMFSGVAAVRRSAAGSISAVRFTGP